LIEAEYTNELRVRDLLESPSTTSDSPIEPQISAMRERVAIADARLKRVFLPAVQIGTESDPGGVEVFSHMPARSTPKMQRSIRKSSFHVTKVTLDDTGESVEVDRFFDRTSS